MSAVRVRDFPDQLRKLIEQAVQQGCHLSKTAAGHLLVVRPGYGSAVMPGTPSDWRGWLNSRAQLARIGIKTEPQRRRRRVVERTIEAVEPDERDPDLEQLALDLMEHAEDLEQMLVRLIWRLHNGAEAGLHRGWAAEDCSRDCATALSLIHQGGLHANQ